MKRTMAVVIALAALTAPAGAQRRTSSAADDADTKEIGAYRLTEPVLQKILVATRAMGDAMQNDPKYREYMTAEKELKALKQKDETTPADDKRIEALEQKIEAFEKSAESSGGGGDAQSLADMERKIAAMPHMSDALRTAGLTPREFALFEMCALQAGIVAGMQKSGQTLSQLPAGIQPANVQFMKDHEKQFEALRTAMQGAQ